MKLSTEHLEELKHRNAVLNSVRHTAMMVQEAHDAWVYRTLSAYGVLGQCHVDEQTGEITRTQPRSLDVPSLNNA